ncbi:MAG: hypothetical protein V4620_02060 [Bacteroidota bacterium]
MLQKLRQILSNLPSKYLKAFQFDLRAFALFRIALGFTMLLDICIRLADIEAFYTANGVLPVSLLKQHLSTFYYLPIYSLLDSLPFVSLCFGIHLVCIVLFTLGYKTKIVQTLCLLFYISLHMRNPYILQGGDDLLRCLLFFSLFLPLNAVWAVSKTKVRVSYTLAAMLFMFQVMLVYFVSVTMKGENEWWFDGTALYYAFNLDFMQWPLAKYLLNYPTALQFATRLTSLVEFIVPMLFFIPYKNKKMRMVGIVILVLFQLAIASTLFVGLFFLVNIVALIPLLPSSFFQYFKVKDYSFPSIYKNAYRKNITVGILAIYLFLWNMNYMPFFKFGLSSKITPYAYAIGINQNWGMFAPCVFKEDGWYIYEAVTNNGDTIDLNNNALPVNYNKPANVLATYKNDRWRKFSEFLMLNSSYWLREPTLNYLKHVYRQESIKSIRLLYMLELTPKPGEKGIIEKKYLD